MVVDDEMCGPLPGPACGEGELVRPRTVGILFFLERLSSFVLW